MTLEVIHELEGDRSADGPQAARQVGRAHRRHRHRYGQSSTATARHVRVAAFGARRLRTQRAEARSTERGTVSWLVRRYVASKSDITPKAREQYAWAIPHIEQGLGAIPLARLDRDDVADWINGLASAGTLSRRSVQICRNVLRASLADAVEEGLIPRSPAARVALPRTVAKPVKEKVVQAWEATDVQRFLAAVADHRWAVGFQLGVLYGLRRSEVLALRWDDFDPKGRTLRIDESLVAVNRGAVLGDAKNVRSRRLVPLSDDGVRALKRRRTEQAEERLLAGSEWEDNDLIIATATRSTRTPPFVRPIVGAHRRQGQAATPHVAWSAPHGGHSHGQQREGRR